MNTARRLLLQIGLVGVSMCACGFAGAQSIQLENLTIAKGENGFIVKGTVHATELNPKGQIVVADNATVVVDIKQTAQSKYQLLPRSMYIRAPAGSQTPYTKGSGPGETMTKEEHDGVGITQLNVATFGLRNSPVWRVYGGLGEWEKNAPAEVSRDFEGTIPLEYAGKVVRIRASLSHRWGGPYAAWPAFSFHHGIGYEGQLQPATTVSPPAGTEPGKPPPEAEPKPLSSREKFERHMKSIIEVLRQRAAGKQPDPNSPGVQAAKAVAESKPSPDPASQRKEIENDWQQTGAAMTDAIRKHSSGSTGSGQSTAQTTSQKPSAPSRDYVAEQMSKADKYAPQGLKRIYKGIGGMRAWFADKWHQVKGEKGTPNQDQWREDWKTPYGQVLNSWETTKKGIDYLKGKGLPEGADKLTKFDDEVNKKVDGSLRGVVNKIVSLRNYQYWVQDQL